MSKAINVINSEVPPVYQVKVKPEGAKRSRSLELTDEQILERAREIMRSRKVIKENTEGFTEPARAKSFFTDYLMGSPREVFAVAYLDSQHRLIAVEDLFKGTNNAAPVYPREVLKRTLELNAAAIIVSHNHPSGNTEPSQADKGVTHRIEEALKHIDLSLLDHIVVGDTVEDAVSFAERGLL